MMGYAWNANDFLVGPASKLMSIGQPRGQSTRMNGYMIRTYPPTQSEWNQLKVLTLNNYDIVAGEEPLGYEQSGSDQMLGSCCVFHMVTTKRVLDGHDNLRFDNLQWTYAD